MNLVKNINLFCKNIDGKKYYTYCIAIILFKNI